MHEPVAIIAQQFPKVVIPLIENAKESIRIIVFDWRWYPSISGSPVSKFNASIVSASSRGVDVRALVNNDAVLERLKSVGCSGRRLHSKRMLHTKMLLIDDVGLIIGSHNYTQHGFGMNEEASVYTILSSKDNDFVKYFEALWGV